MIKHKKKQTPELGFCERNRRSGGYLLQKKGNGYLSQNYQGSVTLWYVLSDSAADSYEDICQFHGRTGSV